jgi:lysozyme
MNLKNWIKFHEGCKLRPYKDTVNKITIGYGRNLQDNGISIQEAELLFDNDYNRCLKDLSQFDWYTDQPEHVQNALMNMCFNLGINKLLRFKRMIVALKEKDYTNAAIEALDSDWAKQVKSRARDVALMMRQG